MLMSASVASILSFSTFSRLSVESACAGKSRADVKAGEVKQHLQSMTQRLDSGGRYNSTLCCAGCAHYLRSSSIVLAPHSRTQGTVHSGHNQAKTKHQAILEGGRSITDGRLFNKGLGVKRCKFSTFSTSWKEFAIQWQPLGSRSKLDGENRWGAGGSDHVEVSV